MRFLALAVALATWFGASTAGMTSPVVAATGGWFVNGNLLFGQALLASTAKVSETFELESAGAPIQCFGSQIKLGLPRIEFLDKGSVSNIVFSECSSQVSWCSIEGTSISTVPLKLKAFKKELIGGALETRLSFLPQTKRFLATIGFLGSECVFEGVQPLIGQITGTLILGLVEAPEHEIAVKVTQESGELTVGSSAAFLRFGARLHSASVFTWSFK